MKDPSCGSVAFNAPQPTTREDLADITTDIKNYTLNYILETKREGTDALDALLAPATNVARRLQMLGTRPLAVAGVSELDTFACYNHIVLCIELVSRSLKPVPHTAAVRGSPPLVHRRAACNWLAAPFWRTKQSQGEVLYISWAGGARECPVTRTSGH